MSRTLFVHQEKYFTGIDQFIECADQIDRSVCRSAIHQCINLIEALWVLRYGVVYDQFDELCELSQSATKYECRLSLKNEPQFTTKSSFEDHQERKCGTIWGKLRQQLSRMYTQLGFPELCLKDFFCHMGRVGGKIQRLGEEANICTQGSF